MKTARKPTIVRKLRDIFSRSDQVNFLGLLVLLGLMALLETAGIASIMPFMLIVTNPGAIHENQWLSQIYHFFSFQTETSFLVFIGHCVLGLLLINNAGKALLAWLTLRYQNRLVYQLSRRLLSMYMARPYSFFLGRNTSKLGSLLLGEATHVVSGVVGPAMDIAANGLVGIAIIALLVIVDPTVALAIVLVLGCAYSIIFILIRKKLERLGEQQVENNYGKFKSAAEALGGIKDLKVLGREVAFLDTFKLYAKRHAGNNVLVGVISQLPRYILEIVAFGGILLVVLHLINQGEQTTGMVPLLALYAFAGYRLLPATQALFAAATNLRFSIATLDVVHAELVDVTDTPSRPEDHLRQIATTQPLPFQSELELKGVSFQYKGAPDKALQNLSLKIPNQSSIGLVGPTGCGKTTTVDLILGLLSPDAGQLLVDGTPVTDENRSSWQRIVGYVPQQIFLTDDTVAANIAFGIPKDQIDMEAVRRAAAIASLSEFIENELPNGYETQIGERGVRLSGGQRQRIGIARAMYRDPAIVVMDEATSALDGVTEEYVMDAVHRLSGRKTVVLIAHRLTTVRECDVIYQLDHGSVVASGTYQEMMEGSAWFRAASRGSS